MLGSETVKTPYPDRSLEVNDDACLILNKMIMTKRERAHSGIPTTHKHHSLGYTHPATPGEYLEPDVTPKIAALDVTNLATKEGFKCPARVTLVNTSLKYIVRDKIKVEGHVQNYDTANTGLDAHQLAEITSTRQEMTKKLSRVIDTSTIIISFDPAEDLHAIRLIVWRVIDVRSLFKQDLKAGLPTDKNSLVRRYLKEEHWKLPGAVQAMMLTLLFYASFSWNKNVTEELNLALFPIDPQEGPPSRHRSKQGLIDEIHKTLMWKYRDRLIRPPTPVLIGENVIRVHVKKWSQLQEIPEFLENLGDYLAKEEAKDRKRRRPGEDADENRTRIRVNSHVANPDPTLQDDFRLISLPISMKTKSQKKGFFVYLDFETVERASLAVQYFAEGDKQPDGVKYKCEQAIPRATQPAAGPVLVTKLPVENQTFNVINKAAVGMC